MSTSRKKRGNVALHVMTQFSVKGLLSLAKHTHQKISSSVILIQVRWQKHGDSGGDIHGSVPDTSKTAGKMAGTLRAHGLETPRSTPEPEDGRLEAEKCSRSRRWSS